MHAEWKLTSSLFQKWSLTCFLFCVQVPAAICLLKRKAKFRMMTLMMQLHSNPTPIGRLLAVARTAQTAKHQASGPCIWTDSNHSKAKVGTKIFRVLRFGKRQVSAKIAEIPSIVNAHFAGQSESRDPRSFDQRRGSAQAQMEVQRCIFLG
jgi:hypothetical protein